MFECIKNGTLCLGLIIGIGLVVIPASYWALLHSHSPISTSNQNSGELNQKQSNPNNISDAIEAPRAPDLKSADHPDHPQYYEHQDLNAQKSMAESTKAIVCLTKISIIIGTLGSFAIIWTLLESLKMTKSARESNQIMRDEQRPFMIPKNCRIEPQDGGIQHVFLEWENVGNGPANIIAEGRTKSSEWGAKSLDELKDHIKVHFMASDANRFVAKGMPIDHKMCWFDLYDFRGNAGSEAIDYFIFFEIKYRSPTDRAATYVTSTIVKFSIVFTKDGEPIKLVRGPIPDESIILGYVGDIIDDETEYT